MRIHYCRKQQVHGHRRRNKARIVGVVLQLGGRESPRQGLPYYLLLMSEARR